MAKPGERAATIEDVARAAGVSRAAVSKVLRNAYGVSEGMRQRVGDAIEELHYRPSVAARAMRGSSFTLGIEIPDFGNPFFAKVLLGATGALVGTNYQLIIAPAEAGNRVGYRAIEALVDQQVDGVIGVAPLVTREWLESIAERTPVVMFGRHDLSDAYDTVAGDDERGTLAIMNHLFELGHDDVLHLTIDVVESEQRSHTPHEVRLSTYLRAMEDSGRSEHIRVAKVGDSEDFAGFALRFLRDAVATGTAPTAIFAAHDELALAVLGAITELGVDISVVGYDDVPMAAHPKVSLTSVDQKGQEMGGRAIEMLLERVQGRTEAVHETYQPDLMVRGTTRAPRG
ncbi:MAG: LacI family transcriptional regulator [Rhodoglobus sp.]|nr:LacI family transcriptional regulator [Rhodoglobus sp.]